ncbi:MAG: hypothetical protein OQK12_19180 [Motiliproteus sp.]|nr:hypothetical protein [Motiliproteus sp.]MCW9050892.1 hypothetical protein [Motiliproteus sp.]
MSLVNDMLRDLDNRRQTPNTNTTSQVITPAAAEQPESGSKVGFAALVTVLALAIAGFLGWPYLKPYLGMDSKPTTKVLMPPEVAIPPPAKSKATETAAIEAEELMQNQAQASEVPVQVMADVSEVTIESWQRTGDGYRLMLSSEKALEYVVDTQSNRQLELQFNNLRLVGEMPALPDSLITAAHVMSLGQNRLLLNLATESPARFQVYPSQTRVGFLLNIELQPEIEAAVVAADKPVTATPVSEETVQVTKVAPQPAPPRPVKPLVKTSKPLTVVQLDRQQVQRASQLIGKQRLKEAESLLERYLIAQPRAIESRRLLASLRIGQGYLKGASQLIETGLNQQPNDSGLTKLKARILLINAKPDEAVALLQQSPPALTDDAEYHQLHAAALQSLGDHDPASKIYYQLLQQDSTQASWWVGLAVSLEALQQTDKAREAYRNVLKIPAATGTLKDFARQRMANLLR